MFYIKLLNNRNEKFIKDMIIIIYNKDLIKYKHAKNLQIISYGQI